LDHLSGQGVGNPRRIAGLIIYGSSDCVDLLHRYSMATVLRENLQQHFAEARSDNGSQPALACRLLRLGALLFFPTLDDAVELHKRVRVA